MEIEPDVIDCMNDILDIVVKKENKRLSDKKYYEKNKEKLLQRQKEYNQENKEKILQYQKEYCEQNREKIKEYKKQYREQNKEKINEYYHDNREKISQQQKQYHQTPESIKSHRISQWKYKGVICDDFDALYDHYTKTSYCDFCRCELTYDKNKTATTKCLDHDHSITDRPNFRNILCHSCNIKRG